MKTESGMASADKLKAVTKTDGAAMQANDLFPVQLYTDLAPPCCPHCHQPGMDLADMMICKGSPMQCEMFEKLMERGWCRIGADVLFKMKLADICCPTHFARIPVADFKVTKSYKHVLKKWQKFLLYGDPRWDSDCDHEIESKYADDAETKFVQQNHQTASSSPEESTITARESGLSSQTESAQACGTQPGKKKQAVKPGLGPDPNKPPCRKAKVVKAEKRAAKLGTIPVANGELDKEVIGKKIALHEVVDKYDAELQSSSPKHKLEMKLFCCNPEDPRITEAIDDAFHIYVSHMKAILPEKETFDTVSEFRWGFVESPFLSMQGERPMGTYHMHYYIDGKLEMFTVMDILPKSVTPIQTYYNPRLRFMSPLFYIILMDIAFAQRLQQQHSEMLYFNIGSYNEFSNKVNFKKKYKPMEIRCPVTNTFVPVEKATPLLQQERYTRLADENVADQQDKETLNVDDLTCYDIRNFGPAPFHDFPEDRKKCLKLRLQQYLYEAGDILKGMLLIIDDTVQLQIKKHMC